MLTNEMARKKEKANKKKGKEKKKKKTHEIVSIENHAR